MAPPAQGAGRAKPATGQTRSPEARLAAAAKAAEAGQRCLSIFATSDVHGSLAPDTIEAEDGQGAVLAGGVLAMSAYARAARASREILLVDAGDLFQGTMAVNQSRGAAIIDAYNALHYDAAAIGNHEFDYGPSPERPSSPTGSLEAAIERAHFPFLAANLRNRRAKTLPAWNNLQASTLVVRAGVRVGIIGVSTPSTPSATLVTHVRELAFLHAAGQVVREATRLRARGAELIVVIAHMGGRCTNVSNPFDRSSCEVSTSRYGELSAMLAELPAGVVDVVVGGHTHEQIAHWYGRTAVVQSGAYGRMFGRVDACVSPGGGIDVAASHIFAPERLCLTAWQGGGCGAKTHGNAPVAARYEGRALEMDPNVVQVVRPYLQAVAEREAELTGARLTSALSADTLAQLLAEGLRRTLRADFGLQNRGGVRHGLAVGPLRHGDVFKAVPFDNHAVSVAMTGADIRGLVLQIAKRRPPRDWPKLSGLSLLTGAHGELVVNTSKGAPLVPDKLYTVATTDFILSGGDGAEGAFDRVPQAHIALGNTSMRGSLVNMLVSLYPN